MIDEVFSAERFCFEVERESEQLTAHGFRRAKDQDRYTPTTASVAYVGQHVGFEFILDIRDQAVELMVARCQNGQLALATSDGYRSSVFSHLLKHCGFRGRSVPPAPATAESSALQMKIRANLNLLAQPCATTLLEDRLDSLP